MSTSEAALTDFDVWLREKYARIGSFTMFVVLLQIKDTSVMPQCSTYFHVIGTEIDWAEMTILLAGAGYDWQGAVFFADEGGGKGPLDNVTARVKQRALEQAIDKDRLHINKGEFFDAWGRRMRIDEVSPS